MYGEAFQEFQMLAGQEIRRLGDIPQVEDVVKGSGSPDQAEKRKLPKKRESSIFCLAQESCPDTEDCDLQQQDITKLGFKNEINGISFRFIIKVIKYL